MANPGRFWQKAYNRKYTKELISMIKLLIALKKRLPFVWRFVEYINGLIFRVLFYKRLKRNAVNVLQDYTKEKFTYRFLTQNDLQALHELFQRQNQEQFRFFKPHDFDLKTLKRLFNNPSFFMFAVFDKNKLIGYFFLRCFCNKKSFTGRFVDEKYQGQGISKRMGKILHNLAWNSNFRVFGTASRDNFKSLNSYQSINNFKIIKELDNNFIYFEYLKSEEKPIK
jgi:GNAT superfamily N-acetyltransferase